MLPSKRADDDFAAEIESHIQLETDRLLAEGASPEAARAAAIRKFGNRTARQEQFYDARGILWDHLLQDFRFALRALRRERSFAAFAILLIGLGAGLSTGMFALYDGIALRKIAAPDPDSLIHIEAVQDKETSGLRYSFFQGLQNRLDLTDSMFAWTGTVVPVTSGSQTEVTSIMYIAGDVTRTMGVRPFLGRALQPSDDAAVTVISQRFWRRIGADPAIVGKLLRAGPIVLTVIGVLPDHSLEVVRFHEPDLIVPWTIGMILESVPRERFARYMVDVSARMKPGVTRAQVQQRIDALWPGLLAETTPPAQSLADWTRLAGRQGRIQNGAHGRIAGSNESLSNVTLTLFLLAALVSLAMCTNLAGLLLSRSLGKCRDVGLRLALGAKRWDVIRYGLVEILLLSAAGGITAILLANWIIEISLHSLSSRGFVAPDYGVNVNGRVIVFGLFLSVITAIGAQLLPALRLSTAKFVDSIKSGTAGASARLGGRKAVLVIQLAASLVLVSGSLLFVRTLQSLARVETGFDSRNTIAVRLAPRVPWSNAGPEYFHELLRRVRSIPAVTAAGLADRAPMEMTHEAGHPITSDANDAGTTSDRACVWPGFFDTLRTPVLAGRDILPSDTNAVVISRSLAGALFPSQAPLGQFVRIGNAPRVQTYQVVGVVADVRLRSPRQSNTRIAFVPCHYTWKPPQAAYAMGLTIRTDGPIANLESAVRQHVDAMGKQAVLQVLPVDWLIANTTRNEQALSRIATGFGAFALLLTCAGVYALIDLTVRSRKRELGIRMALGATDWRILSLMIRGLGRTIVIGVGAGLVLTYAMFQTYRAYLFGIAGMESWLIAGSVALIALLAMAAALLPAWRAARIDPNSVLRLDV